MAAYSLESIDVMSVHKCCVKWRQSPLVRTFLRGLMEEGKSYGGRRADEGPEENQFKSMEAR